MPEWAGTEEKNNGVFCGGEISAKRASPAPYKQALRVPGLARFAEISPQQKIPYNVLSCVYMRAGPAQLGEIPPLLTRDLG